MVHFCHQDLLMQKHFWEEYQKNVFFPDQGGAPGLLWEYQGLLRSEKTMKKIAFMMKKEVALEKR